MKKDKFRELILLIISFVITISLSMNINNSLELNYYNGNSFLWIVIMILIYKLIKEVSNIEDKRMIICSTILASLLSMFNIVGDIINNYLDLSAILSTKLILFISLFKFIGTTLLISAILILIYTKINKTILKSNDKKVKKDISIKKIFFINWGIILICWIPFLLKYFPGILTPDSLDQVKQALNIKIINAHHPLFHTLIIKTFMSIGCLMKSQNIGVFLYSLFQMLTMSAIFSYAIAFMKKNGIPNIILIITFMFFALYPVNAIYSITMWKNILASGAILLFTILIIKIVKNKKSFLLSKINKIIFIIVSLLVIYLLNNGIYIVLFTYIVLLFVYKNDVKKFSKIFTVVIISFLFINFILFSVMDIKKGSIREALSIPLQQFARVVKYNEDKLSNKEKETIYNYLPVENLEELYNPRLSDPVKAVFDDKYFDNNKFEFIQLWIKLFFKYPAEYIESFLCNSYGYWYPEASSWVVARFIEYDKDLNIKTTPIIEDNILTYSDYLIERRDIPVLSMLFSLGFAFWLILIIVNYIIYMKKYKLLVIYVPIITLWLTVIASPVYCEYRYLYGMIVSLPILLTVPILFEEKNKEEK